MFNANAFISSVELVIELQELRDFGLTEEELMGFVDTFFETWIVDDSNLEMN